MVMRKRWVGCCWGSRKGGGKRIVPSSSSRLPDNSANHHHHVSHSSSVSLLPPPFDPSLLAPPSSPASFTNSALPSTAQSPSSFLSLSANSPGGPSSAMYATGPYAHEHQLVSPPVMSTFTTEPSTAPLTPPPELAHHTTPSSPDVPFAQFLSSSSNHHHHHHHHHKGKTNDDLQAAYSLYPRSPPGSGLISPVSRTSGDGDRDLIIPQWDPSFSPQNNSAAAYPRTDNNGVASQDSNFFCPATFAQFYLDHAQETNPSFPHSGGRLSLSRESDVYSSNTKPNKSSHKQDVEEIEAYRASFGFSADEIITTPQYLEITDVLDDSNFTMTPFTSSYKDNVQPQPAQVKAHRDHTDLHVLNQENCCRLQAEEAVANGACREMPATSNAMKGDETRRENGMLWGSSSPGTGVISEGEDIFAKMKYSKKYHMGSSSDAEIDYRRVGSLRESKGKRNDTYSKY